MSKILAAFDSFKISKLDSDIFDYINLDCSFNLYIIVSGFLQKTIITTHLKVFVITLLLMLTACSDPNSARKQALISDMQNITNEYKLLEQSITVKQQKIAFLDLELTKQNSELSEYKRKVNAYMLDHKMAIITLAAGFGGAAVAYDANNEFSEQAQEFGTIAAGMALFYALDNSSEIVEVADQLMQASTNVKALNSQILETQNAINVESEPIAQQQQSMQVLKVNYQLHDEELKSLQQ